jgi:eukaryotic-like serine/threonine-protein kinase
MLTDAARVLGGRYVLEAVIGRGGMADVYRATDLVLEREVAVKLLRGCAPDDQDPQRFHEEAQLLAALDHPGVVGILDAGMRADQPYLVMDLVEGKSLAAFCRGRGIPGHRVANVGAAVAGVLAYCHERGVVHRDVKPSNILLGRDGTVRLADFGIARMLGDTSATAASDATTGTAAYIAPEQVRGEAVTEASDVYSLGLVLLEALTGRRAYPGGPMEAALARLDSAPVVPSSLPTGWPALLTRMTHMDPSMRPSAEAVAPVLRGLEVVPKPSRRHRAADRLHLAPPTTER